jgi:hypothetical protein
MVDVAIVLIFVGLASISLWIWAKRTSVEGKVVWGSLSALFLLVISLTTIGNIQYGEEEHVIVFSNDTITTTPTVLETNIYNPYIPTLTVFGAFAVVGYTIVEVLRGMKKETDDLTLQDDIPSL